MSYTRHLDQPDITDIKLVDGVFIKMMHFRHAEMVVGQHAHEFPHVSLLTMGAVRVWADDVLLGEFVAPAPIHIPARVKHRFLTLAAPTTLWCIHNSDRAEAGEDVAIYEHHELAGV